MAEMAAHPPSFEGYEPSFSLIRADVQAFDERSSRKVDDADSRVPVENFRRRTSMGQAPPRIRSPTRRMQICYRADVLVIAAASK